MRINCISDTHGLHNQLTDVPDGDVLIHAGDLTNSGEIDQVHSFNEWIGQLPHPHKLVIAAGTGSFDPEIRTACCRVTMTLHANDCFQGL